MGAIHAMFVAAMFGSLQICAALILLGLGGHDVGLRLSLQPDHEFIISH